MNAQLALSSDALESFGSRQLSEYAFYRKWGAPFLIWIPAVFGTRVTRFWGVVVLAFFSTSLLVLTTLNESLSWHSWNFHGLNEAIKYNFTDALFLTVLLFPIAFPIMYFIERVFGDLWRSVWFLPTPNMSFIEIWDKAWAAVGYQETN